MRLTRIPGTITTAEAAELLGVHPDTVRNFASRGVLKAERLTPTSPRRFQVADVMRLLEEAQ